MGYTQEVREKVFQLYCEGRPILAISREMGFKPDKETIWGWIKKEDWVARRKEVQELSIKKQNESLADVKVAQAQIAKFVYYSIFKEIQNDKEKIKKLGFSDMMEAMRHHLLLLGGATENVNVDVSIMSIEIQDIMKQLIPQNRLKVTRKEEVIETNVQPTTP